MAHALALQIRRMGESEQRHRPAWRQRQATLWCIAAREAPRPHCDEAQRADPPAEAMPVG